MINYYEPEELRKARYAVKLTYLFGDTKIVATVQAVCCGCIYGADVLNGYTETTDDYPFGELCTFENGKIELACEDDELDCDDGEILVYDKDNQIVASCWGVQELQDHLVGVEIIKVEDLSEEE